MSTKNKKPAEKAPAKRGWSRTLAVLVVLFAVSAVWLDWVAGLTWFIWSFQVTSGLWDSCHFLNPITPRLFRYIEQRDLDFSKPVPAGPVPELPLAEYSYEKLAELSQQFTKPVIVRGLFANATAVKTWTPAYLGEAMGDYETNTVQNGSQADYHWVNCHQRKLSDWAKQEPFNKVMKELEDPTCLKTIVFPPASRSKRVRDKDMEQRFNDLVTRELDLPRIGGGFSSGVKNTVLTQLFAGNGVEGELVGSGWHADICNNFVVQVQGQKKWTFVDPKLSIYMRPTMGTGKVAIAASDRSAVKETVPFLPKLEATLYAGDFLFNPDWLWHSVLNPGGTGYTLGVVSRECHFDRVIKAQPVFTTNILINHLILGITDVEARMRFWSAITGQSLMVNDTAAATPASPAQ